MSLDFVHERILANKIEIAPKKFVNTIAETINLFAVRDMLRRYN